MKHVFVAAALAILILPGPAHAYSAADLLRDCKLQMRMSEGGEEAAKNASMVDALATGSCMGFVDATGQTLGILSKTMPAGAPGRLCLTEAYTVKDGIAAVVKFLESKQDHLDSSAADMAMAGLVEAYPCSATPEN